MPRLFVICICFLSLAANSWTNAQSDVEEAVIRGNAYIDEVLRDMFEQNEYDSYGMVDQLVKFYKKVMFVNVSGEVKFNDGTVKGLTTLHRMGNCILEEEGENLKVEVDLVTGPLNFYYGGWAKFMNFFRMITIEGELPSLEVDLEFTVDAKTGKTGKLTKFFINDMRDMRVWITGLGPINMAASPILSAVATLFESFLSDFMNGRVRSYIAERVISPDFPVEGGRETEAPSTSATPEDTTQPQDPETSTPEESTPAPETPTPEESTPAPETSTPEESTPGPVTGSPLP